MTSRMSDIFNVAKLNEKMNPPLRSQRLHHFFNGDSEKITYEEKVEVINIIEEESKKTCDEIRATIRK